MHTFIQYINNNNIYQKLCFIEPQDGLKINFSDRDLTNGCHFMKIKKIAISHSYPACFPISDKTQSILSTITSLTAMLVNQQ
jgi:hypothetical protein